MRPSDGTHYEKVNSAEKIRLCLSCTRPKCVNCLDPRFIESRRMTKTKDKIKALWEDGKNDMQIAEELGLSHAHVTHLRNEMGLKAHRTRRSNGPYKKREAVQAV